MTPERWQKVKELFDSALERAPDERLAFLDQVCDGDESLRNEVQSLLASYEEGESFMERPAVALAAETLAGSQGESLVGQTIGHYQVTREIGSGGMGEVYLAQDTRLGRRVALKLLPTLFTKDEDRLRRFEQEAHAASALNHPNVCVIYEVGETENDRHYIAMEYVDGVTLRQHMTDGRMKLTEVLDVTVQIASGLATAHEVGIVHRDIKPENIMMRGDGYVKVLDFGLAKLNEQPTTEVTAGKRAKTDTGVVMGTSSYMSPEQARGLAVDARTDIWSLGVVFYEMVASRVPFEGATTSDVIVSILEREPLPLAQPSTRAPAELQQIIIKALRKDREKRYQTVKDLLLDLSSLKQDLELEAKLEQSVQPSLSKRRTIEGPAKLGMRLQPWWQANHWIGLPVLLAIAIGSALWVYFSRPASENMTHSNPESSPPRMNIVPLTTFPGLESWPALSPDGDQVAFVWNGEKGENFDIYIKLVGAGVPLRLTTHPGVDNSPAWSPDGKYIVFTRTYKRESGIFLIPALGGPERKLLPLSFKDEVIGSYPVVTWSPDGKHLAFLDRGSSQEPPGIFLLSVENLEKRQLTSAPSGYVGDWFPAFSPDGTTIAFTRWSNDSMADVYVVPLSGGEPKRLTFDNTWIRGLAWTPNGNSIVSLSSRGGSTRLWKVPLSGGTPEPLAVGGDTGSLQFAGSPPSFSRQGNRLAYAQSLEDTDIWRIELSSPTGPAGTPTQLISSTRYDSGPQYSPDGQRIAFHSARSGVMEIWVCESDGSNPVQLTFLGGHSGTPRWSPDGRQITFDGRPERSADIYVVSAEGGPPRRVTAERSNDVVPSWSRDGRWVYFASSNRGADWQVWKVPAEGGEATQVTKRGGFAAFESPDGKFIYYAKVDSPGLWRISVEGGEESLVLDSPEEGYWGYWAVMERGIYSVDPGATPHAAIEFFSFATGRVTQVAALGKDPVKLDAGFAVSADSRWILYSQLDQSESDIMLVENFP